MANAYNKVMKARTFVIGQMVLKAAYHVRRNLSTPFKFALSWEGPYLVTVVGRLMIVVTIVCLQRMGESSQNLLRANGLRCTMLNLPCLYCVVFAVIMHVFERY